MIENYNRSEILLYFEEKKDNIDNKNDAIGNILFYIFYFKIDKSYLFNGLYNFWLFLDFMNIIKWDEFEYILSNFFDNFKKLILESLNKNIISLIYINKNEYSIIFLDLFNKIKLNKLSENFIQKIKESDKINANTKLEIKKIIQEEYYAYNRKEIKPILI